MKGVLEGSAGYIRSFRLLKGNEVLLLGTNLMSSHHVIGRFEYLLVLLKPISTSSKGASPQSSRFWVLRSAGLASTRYIDSILEARDLNLLRVCTGCQHCSHNAHKRVSYHTRSMSSISVPRPGPTSMISTPLLTFPCAIHSATSHIPSSSPNIWDISGEVIKSPF